MPFSFCEWLLQLVIYDWFGNYFRWPVKVWVTSKSTKRKYLDKDGWPSGDRFSMILMDDVRDEIRAAAFDFGVFVMFYDMFEVRMDFVNLAFGLWSITINHNCFLGERTVLHMECPCADIPRRGVPICWERLRDDPQRKHTDGVLSLQGLQHPILCSFRSVWLYAHQGAGEPAHRQLCIWVSKWSTLC